MLRKKRKTETIISDIKQLRRWHKKEVTDGTALSEDGRQLQAFAAATD